MSETPSEPRDPRQPRLPPHQLATWLVLGAAVVLVAGLFGTRCEHQPETTRDYPHRALLPDELAALQPAPAPDDEYYPCTDCHEDEERNLEPRKLEDEHDDIELAHGELWCLHCHDVDDANALHLADGTRLAFAESWRLCTQCHGTKLEDWRAGVHGKRTGHWLGAKEYRTCVTCHRPHSPRFAPLEPDPPPQKPKRFAAMRRPPEEE